MKKGSKKSVKTTRASIVKTQLSLLESPINPKPSNLDSFKEILYQVYEKLDTLVPTTVRFNYKLTTLSMSFDNTYLLIGTTNSILIIYDIRHESFVEITLTDPKVLALESSNTNNWVSSGQDLFAFDHLVMHETKCFTSNQEITAVKHKGKRSTFLLCKNKILRFKEYHSRLEAEGIVIEKNEPIFSFEVSSEYILFSINNELVICSHKGEELRTYKANSIISSICFNEEYDWVAYISGSKLHLIEQFGSGSENFEVIKKKETLIKCQSLSSSTIVLATGDGNLLIHALRENWDTLRSPSKKPIIDMIKDCEDNLYCMDSGKIFIYSYPVFPYRRIHKVIRNKNEPMFLSENGEILYFLENGVSIIAWNHISNEINKIALRHPVYAHLYLKNNSFIIADNYPSIYTINLNTGAIKEIIEEYPSSPIFALYLTRNQLLVSDSSNLIRVFNLEGDMIFNLGGHNTPVLHLKCLDETLISGCNDGMIIVWNLEKYEEVHSYKVYQLSALEIASGNKFCLAATHVGHIYVFSMMKGVHLHTLEAHLGRKVYSMVYLEEGNLLISNGSDKKLSIWSMDTMNKVSETESSDYWMSGCVSANKQFLAFGGKKAVMVIDNLYEFGRVEIFGNLNKVGSFASYCSKIMSMNEIPRYNLSMDRFIIFPYNINTLHLYAYYNFPEYLKKSLSNEGSILFTSSGDSILSIAVEKELKDCVNSIIVYLKKTHKINPFNMRCVTSPVLLMLNRLSYCELHTLYSILVKKHIDRNPRLCSHHEKLPIYRKSDYLIPDNKDFFEDDELRIDGVTVECWYTLCELHIEFGSFYSLRFMRSLVNAENSEIFKSKFVEILLDYKWKFARKVMMVHFVVYFFFLIILSLFTVYSGNATEIFLIPLILNVILACYEAYQVAVSWDSYWLDYVNYLDLIKSILLFIYFGLVASEFIEEDHPIILIVLIFSWIRGLILFRMFSSTRYMVNLLKETVKDMGPFLFILMYSTLGFSVMFFTIQQEEEDFGISALNSFLMNFGEFNSDDIILVEGIAIVLASIVNPLIMMNLLISIIGDTYDRVQEIREVAERRELAQMIIEIEQLVFWKRDKQEKAFLEVCCKEETEEEEFEWLGLINEMKKEIKRAKKKVVRKVELLEEKADGVLENLDRIEERRTEKTGSYRSSLFF